PHQLLHHDHGRGAGGRGSGAVREHGDGGHGGGHPGLPREARAEIQGPVIGVKPLDGVVVLDLTRFLAGPYCTLLLAGLGAEVIRVEPPGGDLYRAHPPFGGPKGTSLTRQTDDDLGLALLHRMRGKKSVTLNLRAAAGVDLFRRLSAHADVVVENFLPGTLEKMGLGFPDLQAANPRLILCSISGFGQTGPYRDWRAFDPVVQAMSGISSVTGYADRPPVRCGAAISDTTASLYGVIGTLSALRAREQTGHGDWVDVAMLDGSFFLLPDGPTATTSTPSCRNGSASARRPRPRRFSRSITSLRGPSAICGIRSRTSTCTLGTWWFPSSIRCTARSRAPEALACRSSSRDM